MIQNFTKLKAWKNSRITMILLLSILPEQNCEDESTEKLPLEAKRNATIGSGEYTQLMPPVWSGLESCES